MSAAISNEQILEAISKMSVMEIVDLVKSMEEKFGVSAAAVAMAAPMVGGAAGGAAAAPAEEQTEFNVTMTHFGEQKIDVIKIIRAVTGLGLKEAKDMVEGVPSLVKEGVSKDEAHKIKSQLEAVGAKVHVK